MKRKRKKHHEDRFYPLSGLKADDRAAALRLAAGSTGMFPLWDGDENKGMETDENKGSDGLNTSLVIIGKVHLRGGNCTLVHFLTAPLCGVRFRRGKQTKAYSPLSFTIKADHTVSFFVWIALFLVGTADRRFLLPAVFSFVRGMIKSNRRSVRNKGMSKNTQEEDIKMTLHELYLGCRSYRRFTADPVPEEVLRYALENARITNSASNRQPLSYIAVTSKEKVSAMQELVHWAGLLKEEVGAPKKEEEPTAFIVIVQDGPKAVLSGDAGIAAHTITTSLWEKGYGSCMMGAIDLKKINALLAVPEKKTAVLAIAIGKPACTSTIVDLPKDGSTAYYVDEEGHWFVPKRAFEDIVTFA